MTNSQIIDYSDCIFEIPYSTQSEYVNYIEDRYYKNAGFCPFCKKQAGKVFSDSHYEHISDDDPCLNYHHSLTIWSCKGCGWWDMKHHEQSGRDSTDPAFMSDWLYHGALKTYNPPDYNLPVEALRRELCHREDIIHHIHHRKMEELVKSVLKDYLPNCSVSLCAKGSDGGIDLILIEDEVPTAIQVKRRVRPDSVERVECVRAFLGAALNRKFKHLIFITTAKRFTAGKNSAKFEVDLGLKNGLVETFELIDRDRFLGILNLVS